MATVEAHIKYCSPFSCERSTSVRRKRQVTNDDVIRASYDVALDTDPVSAEVPAINTAEVTNLVVITVEDIKISPPNVTIAGQQPIVKAVTRPIVIIGMYGTT